MKNKVFVIFFIGTLLLVILRTESLIDFIFGTDRENFLMKNFELFHNTLLLFPIALLFSSLTLKAREHVFNSWWVFAKVAAPLTLVVTFILNLGLHHSGGGFINIDDDIDMAFSLLLYALFALGSCIQIIRGYRSK